MNIYLILGAIALIVIVLVYFSIGGTAKTEARQAGKTDRVAARQESKEQKTLTRQQQKTCRTAMRQSRRRRGGNVQIPSYCR